MSTERHIRKILPSQTLLLKLGLHLVAGGLLDLTFGLGLRDKGPAKHDRWSSVVK